MKYKKKILIIFLFSFFSLTNVNSLENKIELKVENYIITSIDVLNEMNYLSILNLNFMNLNENNKLTIAKESLIREKIKLIEINKFKNLKLENSILNELLVTTYKNNGFDTFENFVKHLSKNNLNLDIIKKKITIEALWNQIIFSKFSSQIKIDENKIKNEVIKNADKKSKSYNLSEILFNIEDSKNKNKKIDLIKQEINEKGFENAALLYSISETSRFGGKIGWVNFNTLNKDIKRALLNLEIGEITDAIFVSTGFLFLRINDIKEDKIEIDLDKEIQKLVNIKKNQQLNQFSNNYFKKLKKNLKIDEI